MRKRPLSCLRTNVSILRGNSTHAFHFLVQKDPDLNKT
jgi:hypothetical protein